MTDNPAADPSQDYRLSLRFDSAFSRSASHREFLAHLTRIPGVESAGLDRYTFGERDEHGVMTLELHLHRAGVRVAGGDIGADEADRRDELEVTIPRPWVLAKGPRVFALVFMLAEWAKWEVFDLQIDDQLHKEAVLSGLVAMRQAQRENEAAEATPITVNEDYVPTNAEAPPEPAPRRPWWKRGR